MLPEHRLNLCQLDTISPQFDLIITPAYKLNVAFLIITGQISRSVEPRPRPDRGCRGGWGLPPSGALRRSCPHEGMGDKTLWCLFCLSHIAHRQTCSSNIKLPCHPYR